MTIIKKVLPWLLLSCMPAAMAAPVVLDRVAAVVDDGAIMKSEVISRIETVKIQNKGAQLPPQDVLYQQVLERLVLESIQMQMAERAGIRVSDQQLNETLGRIAQQNGMSTAQFRQALLKDGVSYHEATEQIRNEMIISRVQKYQVGDRIKVSEQDVAHFLASKAGQQASQAEFRLGHILLSVADNASPSEVKKIEKKAQRLVKKIRDGANFQQLAIAHSNGRNALKGGDLGWRKSAQLPSLFADTISTMKVSGVSEAIKSSSGFHIIKINEKRGGTTLMVKQTKARHILVMPNEIRSDADAKARINDVYNKLINGADFAKLAKEYSDDPGSGSQGGDLGWTNPGDMVPEFDRQMRESSEGQISKPFKSQFGWHIMQVQGKREADLGKQVQKNQVRQLLQSRKFEEELPVWLRKVRQDAYVDIKQL